MKNKISEEQYTGITIYIMLLVLFAGRYWTGRREFYDLFSMGMALPAVQCFLTYRETGEKGKLLWGAAYAVLCIGWLVAYFVA